MDDEMDESEPAVRQRRMARYGRGAASNPVGRFESQLVQAADDGWGLADEPLPPLATQRRAEPARSIIAENDSPDVGFNRSINPYRGCEHGCIYCYARPSHGYLGLSAGLDFETRLFYKPNAADLLVRAFAKRGYRAEPIALGSNTDPYQPIEGEQRLTRALLEVFLRHRHPVAIISKGAALIERDLDLYAELARLQLCEVGITLTTLRPELKRSLEPRAASPQARLRAIRRLADVGIPVRVMFSPVIPFVNDAELEAVLAAGAAAGAVTASYAFLRLPWEVKDLFREWLEVHAPLKAAHVMSLVQQSRGGKDYVAEFGERMRGRGAIAEMIAQRFKLARRRYGLQQARPALRTDLFEAPVPSSARAASRDTVDERQGRLF